MSLKIARERRVAACYALVHGSSSHSRWLVALSRWISPYNSRGRRVLSVHRFVTPLEVAPNTSKWLLTCYRLRWILIRSKTRAILSPYILFISHGLVLDLHSPPAVSGRRDDQLSTLPCMAHNVCGNTQWFLALRKNDSESYE